MYPGLEPVNLMNDDELNKKYKENMNTLYFGKYVCTPKSDYRNERLLLDLKKSKKKSKRDTNTLDTNVSLGFNWNYVFYYRVKSNIQDFLSCSIFSDTTEKNHAYRQYIDVTNQSANRYISKNTEIADAITKNLVSFRKKSRMYYKEKKPTPFDFWDSEIRTHFRYAEETSATSIGLEKQIRDYIEQGYSVFSEDLAKGVIPEKFVNGIEFYINYILHVSHIPIPDDEMSKAITGHANMLDALVDYSLGNIMSVMKLIIYNLYNPISGLLIADKDQLYSYLINDIQSFSRVIITRLYQQFSKLSDPVFHSLITSLVVNAIFCITAPLLDDLIMGVYQKEDEEFVTAVNRIKETNPERFEILEELMDEEEVALQQALKAIDSTAVVVAPYYRIRGYTNIMGILYQYISQKMEKQGKEMDATAVMDNIAKFIIVMVPDHFFSSSQYITIYKQCVPSGSVNESTLVYLSRGYSLLKKILYGVCCEYLLIFIFWKMIKYVHNVISNRHTVETIPTNNVNPN